MDVEKLEKLNELKEKGILTQEEFDIQKEKLFRNIRKTNEVKKQNNEPYFNINHMEDKNNENIPYINNTTNNKDYFNNYSSQKNGCGIGNILLNIIVTIIVVFTIDYIKSRKSNLENTYTESIAENYEPENEYSDEEPIVEDYEATTEYSDEEAIVEDYEPINEYSDEESIVEDYEIENEEENKTEKEIIIENNIKNVEILEYYLTDDNRLTYGIIKNNNLYYALKISIEGEIYNKDGIKIGHPSCSIIEIDNNGGISSFSCSNLYTSMYGDIHKINLRILLYESIWTYDNSLKQKLPD